MKYFPNSQVFEGNEMIRVAIQLQKFPLENLLENNIL